MPKGVVCIVKECPNNTVLNECKKEEIIIITGAICDDYPKDEYERLCFRD